MVGSIWSRNWPFCTKSPSRTASVVMRPVMSGLTSTFVWGWILPLAVTAATRSRRPTFSKRTSAPFSRLALALSTIKPVTRTAPATPSATLPALDMSRSFRLAQRPADRSFERGHRLVVIVYGADVARLRLQLRHLGVEELEERPGADAVAVGRELQLLAGQHPVRVLNRHRLIRGLQRVERLAHFGLQPERAGAHALLQVLLRGFRLRDLRRLPEVRPQRQRHGEARRKRLRDEAEREDAVLAAQRLLLGARPHEPRAVLRRQPVVLPDRVVVLARGVFLLRGERALLHQAVEIVAVRQLLRDPRPPRRHVEARPPARRGRPHPPRRRALA